MPELYVFRDLDTGEYTTQRFRTLEESDVWTVRPSLRDYNQKQRPAFVADTEAAALDLLRAADAAGALDWAGEA